jgi:hypothetical protein
MISTELVQEKETTEQDAQRNPEMNISRNCIEDLPRTRALACFRGHGSLKVNLRCHLRGEGMESQRGEGKDMVPR